MINFPELLWSPGTIYRVARGRRFSYVAWAILVCLVLAFAITFSVLAVLRHRAYQSHAFDLGNMDQAVWNTLHGRPFRFTDMQTGHVVLTSRLAIHVEPLLLAFAPLYVVSNGPEILLVVQALVVASGAVPAYLLARERLEGEFLALVFPAAYLLHPSLQNVVLDDFHAVALSAPFLLWALLFALRGEVRSFIPVSIIAAATKEEVALLVASMSLLFLRRARGPALVIMCVAVAWFFLCVAVVIPAWNPAGSSPYLGRYAYLGHGLAGILRGVLAHPLEVARVITSPTRVAYFDAVLHPLGWTALLGLPVLLLALPSFAINLLSSDPTMFSGFYQYSAEVVPFVIAASVVGVGFASRAGQVDRVRGRQWIPRVLCLLVLTAALVDSRRYGFTPLADGYAIPTVGRHQVLENHFLREIPQSAVVAAADEIEPHLSNRHWIYLLPTVHPSNGPRADFMVLDASIPSLPTTPRTLSLLVSKALHSGYGVQKAQDGLLLLRYGKSTQQLPGSFYTFTRMKHWTRMTTLARWGALHLSAFTVHPRSGRVTRSRPAISVDTIWFVDRHLPPSTHLVLYCSPIYRGQSPAFSRLWLRVSDGPTVAWFPPNRWRRHSAIRASFLPVVPDVNRYGNVDLAIGVQSGDKLEQPRLASRVTVDNQIYRFASVRVGY